MGGTLNALERRRHDAAFAVYFRGEGVDVGAGPDGLSLHAHHFPGIERVRDWDLHSGDGTYLATIPDASLDFVYSSHCLEHLDYPGVALTNWVRVLKPGGYLVVVVPDEDMYEQGEFPGHNPDHRHSFTIWKDRSWAPKSINIIDLLMPLTGDCEILKVESVHYDFDWTLPRTDQTATRNAEACIEFVLRKRPAREIEAGGRLPQ